MISRLVMKKNGCDSWFCSFPFHLAEHRAEGGTRTRTPGGHHPLKMACLPISPLPQSGEAGWTRTIDPLLKRQMLYHLSYSPSQIKVKGNKYAVSVQEIRREYQRTSNRSGLYTPRPRLFPCQWITTTERQTHKREALAAPVIPFPGGI